MIKVEPLLPRPVTGAGPQAGAVPALPVGSVVAVEAVRDTQSQQLLLLLAGRRWAVKPGDVANALQPGTRLTARVVRAEPDLELAVLSRGSDVASAFRREVPRQGSPLRLLANLQWLADRPAMLEALPAPARAAVEQAWKSLPSLADLTTPDGLEQGLRSSGAELEHRLSTTPRPQLPAVVATDWKAAVSRLQQALAHLGESRSASRQGTDDTPLPTRVGPLNALGTEAPSLAALEGARSSWPAELAQQARESLARIACNQLTSLDARGLPAWPMVVEIPYRAPEGDGGVLRLRIDREQAAARSDAPTWTVEFAFDLGERYGALRGRATLADGRVSVTLHPESSVLAQRIDAHVENLRASIEQAGVPVGRLTCMRSDPFDGSRTGSWLVNLRA